MNTYHEVTKAEELLQETLENRENLESKNCQEGAENAAKDFGIIFIGKIPFETKIGQQGEQGYYSL